MINQERHALTVLTRLAGRRPEETWKLEKALSGRAERLAPDILAVAKETGDPIGKVFNEVLERSPRPDLAASLLDDIPKDTIALRELAVTVATQSLQKFESDKDLSEADRLLKITPVMLDLSVRSSRIGNLQEAHDITQGVIDNLVSTVELPKTNRDRLLGRAYGELSTCLYDLGKRDASLTNAQKSVEIRRMLLSEGDHQSRHELALSLTLEAASRLGVGDRTGARDVATEAVAIYEELVIVDASGYRQYLAGALSKLANFEIELGQSERGIETAKRAISIYRDLADRDADSFSFYVAANANNVANNLSLEKRFEEALTFAEEAEQAFGKLASVRPTAFGPYHSIALNTLSNRLSDVKRVDEALNAARRSVEVIRTLCKSYPGSFDVELGRSLHSFAYRLFLLELWAESIATIDEAIRLRRRLTKQNEKAARTSLAVSLAMKGWTLSKSGEKLGGCDTLSEALRQLIQASKTHGRALHREAKEIGGRYIEAHNDAKLCIDQNALEQLRSLTQIDEFGPIT
ncbi:MAG: tetratricopeptide repeat protein [Pseudomonadota bacterium]